MRTVRNNNPGAVQQRAAGHWSAYMADPSLFDVLRIPAPVLIALDNRTLHFAMQPYHYVIRLTHIMAMGAFFGGVGLLDFRLMGWRGTVPLKMFAEHVLPWLWVTCAVAICTGIALFAYDPVHVGSHAYFAPKILLIVAGGINAALFHRTGYLVALASEGRPPRTARIAGAVSLALWMGVVICSSLNVEGVPKVFLR